MKHLGLLSCILSLLGIAALFIVNMILVPWMAGGSIAAGIAGLIQRKRGAPPASTILAAVGTTVGLLTLAFWTCVMLLAWSADIGAPL